MDSVSANVKKGRAKSTLTLEQRAERLNALVKEEGPAIRINHDKFTHLVRGSPRNYSFFLLLTALSDRHGCTVCREAHGEYVILANSWRYSPDYGNAAYFGVVDFDDAPQVFQDLKQNSAPLVLYFPQKGTLKKVERMDIQRVGFSAEAMSHFVRDRTGFEIRVYRPRSYTVPILVALGVILVATLLYVRRNDLSFLYNHNAFGVLALFIVLASTSGQMWNHIRRPPYQHNTQNGPVYIQGNSGGQFVAETYIVAAINGAVVVGMIIMNEAARSKWGSKVRKGMAIVGLAIMTVFFSYLLSIFRRKSYGYPYRFLFE